jgi:hypothetical protein
MIEAIEAVHVTDRKVTGPLVNQYVMASQLAAADIGPKLVGIYIFCRGANKGAQSNAFRLIKKFDIDITFIEVPNDTPMNEYVKQWQHSRTSAKSLVLFDEERITR